MVHDLGCAVLEHSESGIVLGLLLSGFMWFKVGVSGSGFKVLFRGCSFDVRALCGRRGKGHSFAHRLEVTKRSFLLA